MKHNFIHLYQWWITISCFFIKTFLFNAESKNNLVCFYWFLKGIMFYLHSTVKSCLLILNFIFRFSFYRIFNFRIKIDTPFSRIPCCILMWCPNAITKNFYWFCEFKFYMKLFCFTHNNIKFCFWIIIN